ncbi:hypothetical protein RHMOL_Rhmol05G0290100 [Rhododendron molle]|uniref:Uncharacterized protein n=1 Tax=Rhododendron molle TaxID=49168 RepID=A0ACC0NV74_RHOML|nr:hypothetical protein RHMOL_Rhmol05G0290100 [Rhododendron molle]
MRVYQFLNTNLNRKGDFTGNLDRISVVISIGRWNVVLAVVDLLHAIAPPPRLSSGYGTRLQPPQCTN